MAVLVPEARLLRILDQGESDLLEIHILAHTSMRHNLHSHVGNSIEPDSCSGRVNYGASVHCLLKEKVGSCSTQANRSTKADLNR